MSTKNKDRIKQTKAFTLIELLVVIIIIIILLAIAIPGLSYLNKSAKQFSAISLASSTIQKAYNLSLTNRNLTAIRFAPTKWVAIDNPISTTQSIIVYQWECSVSDKHNPIQVIYNEHLERCASFEQKELPSTWQFAPVQSLSNPKFTTGVINKFNTNPDDPDFLNMDDFMLVLFEGRIFFRPDSNSMQLYDLNPDQGYNNYMDRYVTDAFVLYNRDVFLEISSNNDPINRQRTITQYGQIYSIVGNGNLKPQ